MKRIKSAHVGSFLEKMGPIRTDSLPRAAGGFDAVLTSGRESVCHLFAATMTFDFSKYIELRFLLILHISSFVVFVFLRSHHHLAYQGHSLFGT